VDPVHKRINEDAPEAELWGRSVKTSEREDWNDCFLAAGKVGIRGRVIGVDMTPEMVDKARGNARKGGNGNVEFRPGGIPTYFQQQRRT